MVLLDNTTFLKSLRRLYEENRDGSVFITFKSIPEESTKKEKKAAKGPNPKPTSPDHVCLVRATNGKNQNKRTKISTQVKPKDLQGFQMALNKLFLSEMSNLKKVERKKKKKVQHL